MEIFHSKYGTGLVIHNLSVDGRTVDLVANGDGPTSQRFLILTTVRGRQYSYCVVRSRSYAEALHLALKEHDRLGHPLPRLCGVIGEAEDEVSGTACLICLEFHRGKNGAWTMKRPVLFSDDDFQGFADGIVDAWIQRQEAAGQRPQVPTT